MSAPSGDERTPLPSDLDKGDSLADKPIFWTPSPVRTEMEPPPCAGGTSLLASTQTRLIRLDHLVPGKDPRHGAGDVDDLLESFSQGAPQLQNIVVRRVPGKIDRFEIITGNRRVRAARKKGWSHIEAKILDVDDVTAEVYGLEENLRRRQLPDEATALARLVDLYALKTPSKRGGDHKSNAFKKSKSQKENLKGSAAALVAQAVGQSRSDVYRKIRIGRLGTLSLKRALADGLVTIGEAEKFAGLPPREQEREVSTLGDKRRVAPATGIPVELHRALAALGFAERAVKQHRRHLPDEVVTKIQSHMTALVSIMRGNSRSPRTSRVKTRAASKGSRKRKSEGAAQFEPKSYNRKLAPTDLQPHSIRPRIVPQRPFVSATDVSIQATCSDSCPFKGAPGADGGCYVDAGFTAIKAERLDDAAWGLTSIEVIAEEARQIQQSFGGKGIPQDGAKGGRDLRLHVGGDAGSAEGARLLAKAARDWKSRGGGSIWTFTHDWKRIPRTAWGEAISVLASVETPREIEVARKRGYPCAIVVEEFPNNEKAFQVSGSKANIFPCPAETKGVTCVECRLCLDRDLVKANTAIAFRLHGQRGREAREALAQAQPACRSAKSTRQKG